MAGLGFFYSSRKYIYHGTSRKSWEEHISREGLNPVLAPDFGGIVAVFFSESITDAYSFGALKAYYDHSGVVVLALDVECARRNFILLHRTLGLTLPRGHRWVSHQRVPPECLSVKEEPWMLSEYP